MLFGGAWRCAVLTLFVSAASLQAATLDGLVVGVADGDTLTLLDGDMRQHKIRLAGIDAPEKGQDFGQTSKQSLSELAYRRYVRVEVSKRDRYGRSVAKVLRGTLDVNLEQVRRGLAWHYKEYEREQSTSDRRLYSAAENEAKASRTGLWALPHPIEPWHFRRKAPKPRIASRVASQQQLGRAVTSPDSP